MVQRRPLTPSEFTRRVASVAAQNGWRHHHSSPSRQANGYADFFPSEILIRPGRILFLALANTRGQVDPHCHRWLLDLEAAGAHTAVLDRSRQHQITRLLIPATRPAPQDEASE